MKTYNRKKSVKAIQLTTENKDEVFAFCKKLAKGRSEITETSREDTDKGMTVYRHYQSGRRLGYPFEFGHFVFADQGELQYSDEQHFLEDYKLR